MRQSTICFRSVGRENMCTHCNNGVAIRYGYTKGGNQRLRCTSCRKTKVQTYKYNAYNPTLNKQIVTLSNEGLGIRSIARALSVSTTTLLSRFLKIAESIPMPPITMKSIYEVDEICTFVRNKENKIWIVYGLDRTTKNIACFSVGKRTKRTLNVVLKTLLLSKAKRIYTDDLRLYKTLLPNTIHKVTRFGTNHIERCNLSLRTHLKRLSRRSICFSKSLKMLNATLKIYFWSQ